MEYGSEEYWKALRNFLDVIYEEAKHGKFTDKGMRDGGTDALFNIVWALKPWGVYMAMSAEPIDHEK